MTTTSGLSRYHAVATGDHLACSSPVPDANKRVYMPLRVLKTKHITRRANAYPSSTCPRNIASGVIKVDDDTDFGRELPRVPSLSCFAHSNANSLDGP